MPQTNLFVRLLQRAAFRFNHGHLRARSITAMEWLPDSSIRLGRTLYRDGLLDFDLTKLQGRDVSISTSETTAFITAMFTKKI